MIQRTLGIILILAIIAVGGYDAWRYTETQERLRKTTYELARWAAENASTLSREQAAQQLVTMATAKEVVVYQYGQTENGAQVWTQAEVKDTIVAGIIANMVAGKPFAEARKAPFIIRDYREAGFQ